MNTYDSNRPYTSVEAMPVFIAIRKDIARKFGKNVKALECSNREYQRRFDRFSQLNRMKFPPSSEIHIMSGYCVIRKLGSSAQYETWMPDEVFHELYRKTDAA